MWSRRLGETEMFYFDIESLIIQLLKCLMIDTEVQPGARNPYSQYQP